MGNHPIGKDIKGAKEFQDYARNWRGRQQDAAKAKSQDRPATAGTLEPAKSVDRGLQLSGLHALGNERRPANKSSKAAAQTPTPGPQAPRPRDKKSPANS